jgi:hypothetical protein
MLHRQIIKYCSSQRIKCHHTLENNTSDRFAGDFVLTIKDIVFKNTSN